MEILTTLFLLSAIFGIILIFYAIFLLKKQGEKKKNLSLIFLGFSIFCGSLVLTAFCFFTSQKTNQNIQEYAIRVDIVHNDYGILETLENFSHFSSEKEALNFIQHYKRNPQNFNMKYLQLNYPGAIYQCTVEEVCKNGEIQDTKQIRIQK